MQGWMWQRPEQRVSTSEQRRGEDIGAKEEGMGWGMVTVLDDQYQVVQSAAISALKTLPHGFDRKKMSRLDAIDPLISSNLVHRVLRPATPPVHPESRKDQ